MNPITKKQPWVDVAIFENLTDGQKLELFLKQNRFAARVFNDRLLQLFLFLCPPRAVFRVQVRFNDYKVVTDMLNRDITASKLAEAAVHCPDCDSRRVQYPQMTRKFFLPTVLLHFGIIFRIIEHEAYCENCHYLWRLPKTQISVPLRRAHQK